MFNSKQFFFHGRNKRNATVISTDAITGFCCSEMCVILKMSPSEMFEAKQVKVQQRLLLASCRSQSAPDRTQK